MSEFELIFNKDKNTWYVRFANKNWSHNPVVSVRFLINPTEDEKMFSEGEIYKKMLKWLKENHSELML